MPVGSERIELAATEMSALVRPDWRFLKAFCAGKGVIPSRQENRVGKHQRAIRTHHQIVGVQDVRLHGIAFDEIGERDNGCDEAGREIRRGGR